MEPHFPVLRRAWRELAAGVLDLVLPPHCPGCGERIAEQLGVFRLCRPCSVELERLPDAGCHRCGEAPSAFGASACGSLHRSLVGLAFATAAFRYRGAGGALVRRLKLRSDFGALDALAASMARALVPRLSGGWRRAVLVPVPLHRERRRARGFDQARLLAEAVAVRAGLEVAAGMLARVRKTLPQGDPRVVSREQNVLGAFAVNGTRSLRGRDVLLVDDVMTSGATARACAALLAEHGAGRIALVTACRARAGVP